MAFDRYAVALDMQDARNVRAIAKALVKACRDVASENGGPLEDDAAIVLLVWKLDKLCQSNKRFGPAYAVCCEKTSRIVF